jgi:hypothetical protein
MSTSNEEPLVSSPKMDSLEEFMKSDIVAPYWYLRYCGWTASVAMGGSLLIVYGLPICRQNKLRGMKFRIDYYLHERLVIDLPVEGEDEAVEYVQNHLSDPWSIFGYQTTEILVQDLRATQMK